MKKLVCRLWGGLSHPSLFLPGAAGKNRRSLQAQWNSKSFGGTFSSRKEGVWQMLWPAYPRAVPWFYGGARLPSPGEGLVRYSGQFKSVHKHRKVKEWLFLQQGRVHFVFTPTRASWLNQIKLWFSILTRKVIKRGIFAPKEELVQKIMQFIEKYNSEAKPFKWTYTGDPLKI